MEPELVFTIIPNWNLKQDLRECLSSLLQSDDPANLIVVVDNGSTDGSLEMVQADFPTVKLLAQGNNLGYAGALNAGFRYALQAGADYVLALNNDTVVPVGTVRRLVATARQHPHIGLLSPLVLYYDDPTRIFSLGSRSYSWLPLPFEFGNRWRDRPDFHRLLYYDYVTGCANLIPMPVLRQVGLMDTAYFMNYEDNDFCRRLRNAGWAIAVDGRISILHKASLSLNRDRRASLRRRARNKVWFFRRYRHGPAPWLTRLALLGSVCFYATRHVLGGNLALARAQLAGFWEGWTRPFPEPSGTRLDLPEFFAREPGELK